MRDGVKIYHLKQALQGLGVINEEIRYKSCAETEGFSAGLIAFRPRKSRDTRQISHSDRDVICHVLKGRGRLRLGRRRVPLQPGTICHIPKGTPHDFAAGQRGELVLFYSLIRSR